MGPFPRADEESLFQGHRPWLLLFQQSAFQLSQWVTSTFTKDILILYILWVKEADDHQSSQIALSYPSAGSIFVGRQCQAGYLWCSPISMWQVKHKHTCPHWQNKKSTNLNPFEFLIVKLDLQGSHVNYCIMWIIERLKGTLSMWLSTLEDSCILGEIWEPSISGYQLENSWILCEN